MSSQNVSPMDLDREQRVVAATELVQLAEELEESARVASLRAQAARAGARALLIVRDAGAGADRSVPVSVGDDNPVETTYARTLRIAQEIGESLLRNMPGIDRAAARAAANNLAAGWGDLGREGGPDCGDWHT
jgi:hypothetical protein